MKNCVEHIYSESNQLSKWVKSAFRQSAFALVKRHAIARRLALSCLLNLRSLSDTIMPPIPAPLGKSEGARVMGAKAASGEEENPSFIW